MGCVSGSCVREGGGVSGGSCCVLGGGGVGEGVGVMSEG